MEPIYTEVPQAAACGTIEVISASLAARRRLLEAVSSRQLDCTGFGPGTITACVTSDVKLLAWQCLCRNQQVDLVFVQHGFGDEWSKAFEGYKALRSLKERARQKPVSADALKRAQAYLYSAIKQVEKDLKKEDVT